MDALSSANSSSDILGNSFSYSGFTRKLITSSRPAFYFWHNRLFKAKPPAVIVWQLQALGVYNSCLPIFLNSNHFPSSLATLRQHKYDLVALDGFTCIKTEGLRVIFNITAMRMWVVEKTKIGRAHV